MVQKKEINILIKTIVPYFLTLILIYSFASLGIWQLKRAEEKKSALQAFVASDEYLHINTMTDFELYQKIKAQGKYINNKQIIIDNIIRDGQLGHIIITPFEINASLPWLLVNRGWIQKSTLQQKPVNIKIHEKKLTIKGSLGKLPKIGIRDAEAFENKSSWPIIGIYPTISEIEDVLNQKTLPYILLLSPEDDNGYIRKWEPKFTSPSTNYGYAAQWFLMCLASVIFLIIRIKKSYF